MRGARFIQKYFNRFPARTASKHNRSRFFTRHRAKLLPVLLLALLSLPILSERNDYSGKIIESIDFIGITNLSPDELRGMLNMQVGAPFEEQDANTDIRTLYSTGYFSNVVLRMQLSGNDSVKVFFEIEELPRIRDIHFQGVEELFANDLIGFLPFKEGEVFSLQKIKDGVGVLKGRYKLEGFFFAEIWYRIESVGKNQVDVYYIIDEGENIPVAKINIIGPVHLNPDDMRELMELKEHALFEEGIFSEAKFDSDQLRIVGYAKSKGYLDAEIDPAGTGYEIRWKEPSRPEKGRVVIVTYKINEGEIWYFGGYSLEHDPTAINKEYNPPERKKGKPINPLVKKEDLIHAFEYGDIDIGDAFDEGKYFRDRTSIQEIYSQYGYVFNQVQPIQINFPLTKSVLDRYEKCSGNNPATDPCSREASYLNLPELKKTIEKHPELVGKTFRHTHFVIRENGLAYIEKIIIKGMEKTQERVIRRELLFKEDQLFNSLLVSRSREKLVNLGYFSEVNFQMRPGSDDTRMILVIDVKEQPTGTLSLGGGYGTATGFSIFAELGNTNVNGTGQSVTGKVQYGPSQRQTYITWTNPWFYEKCEENTGNFWRTRLKEFDGAANLAVIDKLAGALRNNYAEYGKEIQRFVGEALQRNDPNSLDHVKARIRGLIYAPVVKEEKCFRDTPHPWSLSFSAYQSTQKVAQSAAYSVQVMDNQQRLTEDSTYEYTTSGIGIGFSHTLSPNWAHYHQYRPMWTIISRPTALVNDEIIKRSNLGWQFRSALRNGLVFNTVDNIWNPTRGLKVDLSVEFVGQLLGGEDHYNRYDVQIEDYWSWFDYTFGGFFKRNSLRRWKVVQQVRLYGTFVHEAAPNKAQDKTINPYIEQTSKLYLGGYEMLRGYDYADLNYPTWWRDGGSHMITGGTELRFPLEPTMFWLVLFMDGGMLFDNIGEYTGQMKDAVNNYNNEMNAQMAIDPLTAFLNDRFNLTGGLHRNFYGSKRDWNDPKRVVFSTRNLALDRAVYSYGFGLRVQIPMMPLRLYFARKLYYDGEGSFQPMPNSKKFEFVFGIGDYRY